MRQVPVPPKTLQLLIRNEWLVESLTSLGSGYITHLVYPKVDIDPAVLKDLTNHVLGEGVLGEVGYIGRHPNRKVAEVEIFAINDYQSFTRFDLRLLEVGPFIRDGIMVHNSKYLCYYKNPG